MILTIFFLRTKTELLLYTNAIQMLSNLCTKASIARYICLVMTGFNETKHHGAQNLYVKKRYRLWRSL